MNDRPAVGRWAALVLFAILALAVGVVSYNAGVSHGLATNIPAGATVHVWPPYVGLHPFGFVFPFFFFVLFWFVAARLLFWGRPWRRRWHDDAAWGAGAVPSRLEEWHRQMHERMKT